MTHTLIFLMDGGQEITVRGVGTSHKDNILEDLGRPENSEFRSRNFTFDVTDEQAEMDDVRHRLVLLVSRVVAVKVYDT